MSKKNYAALTAQTTATHSTFKPRELIIDIETCPAEVGIFGGLYNQNISLKQVRSPGRVICFAAQWSDSKTVEFYSEWETSHEDMVRQAYRLFNEADVIIGHNSKAFDIKHLQTEMFLLGLTPPSPHKDVDTLLEARKRFRFLSNKLDWISQQLGIGEKVKHEGFELWDSVLAGDKKAQARMKKYNIQDVRLTKSLFEIMRPWIKGLPNLNLWTGKANCYACGSDNLTVNGFARTTTAIYERLHCGNCGAWNRKNTIKGRVETRAL